MHPGKENSLLKLMFADTANATWLRKLFILMVQGRQGLVMFEAPISLNEMLERSPDSLAAGKFMLQNIWGADEQAHLTQERRWQRRVLGFKNQRLSVKKNSGKGVEVQFARRQIKA
ncbi:MAG: hypothetical protein R3194_12445 [Limnobacter sp.]|nr:hypothetical protein [Limnobacter sp.]